MLKTKEQLLYYFNGRNIKLSLYDAKFCQNIQNFIVNKNSITTNQKALFEKLISKYKKQIIKAGLDVEICKELPWTTNIVPSEEKYTGAQVSLDGNNQTIVVKVPFNSKFINSLRDVESKHCLEWIRDKKHYVSPLSTCTIKFLLNELHKYFPTVTFDSTLQGFIDEAKSYNAKVYSPTLMCVNNHYIIAAINNDLYENTKHIELNDDAKTLFLLSQYGVAVSDDIIKGDKKKSFAHTVVVNVDVSDLNDVLGWLREFDVDMVYFGGRFSVSSTIMYSLTKVIRGENYTKKINRIIKNMEKQLSKLNIQHKDNGSFFKDSAIENQPVVIQFMQGVDTTMYQPGKRVAKFITVVDSSPIDTIEIIHETS